MAREAAPARQRQFWPHGLEGGFKSATAASCHEGLPGGHRDHPDQRTETAITPTSHDCFHQDAEHLRAAPVPTAPAKANTDPWLDSTKDPWSAYQGKAATPQGGEVRPRLTEICDQLCLDVKAKVSKDLESSAQAAVQAAVSSSAEAPPQEERLQALEVGVHELKQQNVQFTSWFQQAGDRMQATEHAVTSMQHTLNGHQQEIHTLGHTFQNTMKTIKQDLSSEMSDNFNKQLSRLEALLEKKQRSS